MMMEEFEITELNIVDVQSLSGVQKLLSQVASASVITDTELAEIVSGPTTKLLVARACGGSRSIEGMLTIVVFRIPSGLRVWIEDVVVDNASRRRGIAEALNRAAIDYATAIGARTVDLTSRPSRVAANQLYQKLGFQHRETNVYRLELKP